MRDHEQSPGNSKPAGNRTPAIAADAAAIGQAAAAVRAGRGVSPAGVALLQRAAGNSAVASALGDDLDGSLVHSVIGTGGQPLDPNVQEVMESRLGADLSDVRIHTDDRSSQSAQAINAQAYTAGNHIVFQRQEYQPGTDRGIHMLAHELTHVVQQRSGPVDSTPIAGDVSVSHPMDPFEQAAERTADSIVQSIGGAGGISSLQRQLDNDDDLA